MIYIEDYLSGVKYNGLNTAKDVDFAASGSVKIGSLCLTNSTATVATGSCVVNAIAGVVKVGGCLIADTSGTTFYIKNSKIGASDLVFANIIPYSVGGITGGTIFISTVAPATGSVSITLANHSGAASAGTCKVAFIVVKAS